MRDITIKDEGSKRTILQRGTRPQQSHQFFKTIFEAWKEGYKLPEDPKRDELSLRNY
jgi:Ni/Co efflux regulator RcnB